MYSRIPTRPPHPWGQRLASVPSHTDLRTGVYVPPNYSGTAIGGSGGSSADAPPPDTPPTQPATTPQAEKALPVVEVSAPTSAGTPTSMPLAGLWSAKHFPWGHGIGSEELFLLGVWLFLASEHHREDGEWPLALWLVGALLFCG